MYFEDEFGVSYADWRANKNARTDATIAAFPTHANEYVIQLEALTEKTRYSAEEKLHMIAERINNHKKYPQNWTDCAQCAVEPMHIKRMS